MLRRDLLRCLEACMSAVESDSNAFIFLNKKIYSHSYGLTICHELQTDIADLDIDGEVKATELFNTLNKFSKDEVSVVQKDNLLILKCGRAKAELSLKECDYSSVLKDLSDGLTWIDAPADFITAFGCRIPKNTSKCSGVYVDGEYLYSTNVLHLARYHFTDAKLPPFWLPEKSIDILTKLKNITKISVTDTNLHVKTDDAIYSFLVLISTNYPIAPISRLLSEDYKDTDIKGTLPQELFNAIDRATQFGIRLEADIVTRLTFSEDNIEVYSERSTGKYSETVDWEEKPTISEPLTIYVGGSVSNYLSKRATKFYLSKVNREIPRLFLESDNTVYLISTFDINKHK